MLVWILDTPGKTGVAGGGGIDKATVIGLVVATARGEVVVDTDLSTGLMGYSSASQTGRQRTISPVSTMLM